jgi:HSP20 family protein
MIRRIKAVSRVLRIETEIDSIGGGGLIQESELAGLPQSWVPSVDVYEKETEVIVEIEVPGISRKNLRIWHYGNHIEIRGVKKEALKEGHKKYLRLERAFGSFRRVVFLPRAVSTEKTAAYLENGILTVVLKKKRSTENRPGGGHGQRR